VANSRIVPNYRVDYIVDEPFIASTSTSTTKQYSVGKGLFLLLLRGNASSASTQPKFTVTDSSGVTAMQSGAVGGSVFLYKLVMVSGENLTFTVVGENLTSGGEYTAYNRVTILKLC